MCVIFILSFFSHFRYVTIFRFVISFWDNRPSLFHTKDYNYLFKNWMLTTKWNVKFRPQKYYFGVSSYNRMLVLFNGQYTSFLFIKSFASTGVPFYLFPKFDLTSIFHKIEYEHSSLNSKADKSIDWNIAAWNRYF